MGGSQETANRKHIGILVLAQRFRGLPDVTPSLTLRRSAVPRFQMSPSLEAKQARCVRGTICAKAVGSRSLLDLMHFIIPPPAAS